MKRLIHAGALLIITGILTTGNAQAQEGKQRWKETQRLDAKKKAVSYVDTYYLHFDPATKNELLMRRGSFMYKGALEKKKIIFTDRAYNILTRNDNEIRLQDIDDGTIFIFTPEKVVVTEVPDLKAPTATVTNLDLNNITGKWFAYKRTSKDGGPIKDLKFGELLQNLEIFAAADANGTWGHTNRNEAGKYIYEVTGIESGIIKMRSPNGSPYELRVLLADGKEITAEGSEGVIYHFMRNR